MKTATFLWTTGYTGCHSSILCRGGDLHGKPNPHQKLIWWTMSFEQGEYIKWILLRRDDIKDKWNHMSQKSFRFLIPYARHRWNCWHWPGTKTEQESTVRMTRAFFGYVKRFTQVTYESPGPRVIPSPWGGWAYLCPDPLVCGVYNFTLKKSSHFFNTKFLSRCSPNY